MSCWVSAGGREIAFLVPDFVAEVRHFITAAVPDAFLAVNGVERAIALGVELDVVENEKFGFRTEEGLVAEAGGDEIFFRLLRDAARVACKAPACRFRQRCR